jgi:hypothetical protein
MDKTGELQLAGFFDRLLAGVPPLGYNSPDIDPMKHEACDND